MKSILSKNVIIGITIIVALGLLYWGIEFLKGINLFKPVNYYQARFEQVDGLNVASPVTINGFKVGQVSEIRFDYETNQILVEMSMDKNLKIPVGSTISLASSLMGSAGLELNLSKNPAYMKVGDVISSNVQTGLMDHVSDDVLPQVSAILPKVDSIMGNVNTLVGNPALHTSVSRLDGITAQLAQSSQELNTLIRQLNTQVPGIMNNVNSFTGKLNTSGDDINQMTAQFKSFPIDSTLNNLNSTVANLQQLSVQLNNHLNSKDSSLGLLLNDKQLYQNASNSLNSLDSQLQDVKKHPSRYINVKVF